MYENVKDICTDWPPSDRPEAKIKCLEDGERITNHCVLVAGTDLIVMAQGVYWEVVGKG